MQINTRRDGFNHPESSSITPLAIYQSRRDLIRLMATGVAGAALGSLAARQAFAQSVALPGKNVALPGSRTRVAGGVTMDKMTDYKDASSYNNFYEFGTDKADPAKNAHTLKISPWAVEIEGLVKKPARYTLEDLIKLSAQEERIYRAHDSHSSIFVKTALHFPSLDAECNCGSTPRLALRPRQISPVPRNFDL